ncbi:MAG TPA: ABC transporter permease, partial [Gemmatimonadales bacterium]|nr:ABC transporter permease [Gemmatimonadales bacterium]
GDNPRSGWDRLPLSFPNYSDLREQSSSFEELGAWTASRDRRLVLSGSGGPEQLQYAAGSASLFRVLGVHPSAGRVFSAEEDRPESERVVLLSNRLWRSRFGSDPGLIGSNLSLNGEPHRVVGVLPPDFRFVTYPKSPDLWLPLQQDPATGTGNRSARYARGAAYLGTVGLLKNGISLAEAGAEVSSLAGGLASRYPDVNSGWAIKLVGFRDSVAAPLRPVVVLLIVAVGVMLLVACANVAGLVLARGVARRRELAVRAALGATRGRLVSGQLAESLILGVAGGLLGMVLAVWLLALPVFAQFQQGDLFIPYSLGAEPLRVDLPILGFAIVISLVTGALVGLVPGLRASRVDLQTTLKGDDTPSGHRSRSALVLSQVALSLILLTGTALLVRSLLRLEAVDPGFRSDNVLAVDLNLPRERYQDAARIAAFYNAVLERSQSLPGVRSAAVVEQMPLSGELSSTDFRIEGRPDPAPNQEPQAQYGAVSSEYFEALGIRLIAGRGFQAEDSRTNTPVAIISEATARRYWPGESAVGKRLALSIESLVFGPSGPPHLDFSSAMREVVGVVSDVKSAGLAAESAPQVYLPFAQRPARDMTVVIATVSDPLLLAGPLRQVVLEVDPQQPVAAIRTLTGMVAESLGEPRFRTYLLSAFAAIALMLAAVGLFGLVAFMVSQRRREIGVRMALGASPGQVMRLALLQGLRPVLAGVALGIPLALLGTRFLSGMLFGVSPADPFSFGMVSVILVLVAVIACYLPARRVMSISPSEAMRAE